MTIATLHRPQYGDSAVISATQRHRSETVKELVASGANLNLQNQVIFQLLYKTLHYVSSPDVHIRKV